MADVAYLDATAIVKLVVAERESWALGDFVRGRSCVSSDISRVEVPRSVRRLGLESDVVAQANDVLRRFTLLKLDRASLSRASRLEPVTLRSIDAIHLGSAMGVPGLGSFVTYDRRLADAAQLAGIPVASPA